jgi:hypothetical protein
LASHFNNDDIDRVDPSGGHLGERAHADDASGVADEPSIAPAESPAPQPTVSAAVIKFRSCRWRRPPEDGPECCGHRDVLPIAGTTSFDADAWCPDCTFFKLRRMPKKRVLY